MQRADKEKHNLDQTFLFGKMRKFLKRVGEDFPEGSEAGLCDAYVLLRIRACSLGDEKKYKDRLQFLSAVDPDCELKIMSDLFNQFKTLYIQNIAKLEKQLEEKLKGKTEDEKEKITIELTIEYCENIILQVANGNGEKLKLLRRAYDLYYFIHTLLASQYPFKDYQYRVSVSKEEKKAEDDAQYRPVNQGDFIKTIALLENKRIEELSIHRALSFSFVFQLPELAGFCQAHIKDGDMVRICSTTHTMYISRRGDKLFILDDPNSGPYEFDSPEEFAKAIQSCFFLSFKRAATWMPITIDIYEDVSKPIQRTPLKKILAGYLTAREKEQKSNCINAAGWDKTTALSFATQEVNIPLVGELLDQGADPDTADKDLATPLFYAAAYGSLELVRIFACQLKQRSLEAKMNVARSDTGLTPLLITAASGFLYILEELAKHVPTSEFSGRDKKDRSVLHLAASNVNSEKFINALLEHLDQKDVPRELVAKDSFGLTPTLYAAKDGNPEALKALLLARRRAGNLDFSHDLTNNNLSPLAMAAFNNHPAAIRIIAQYDPEQLKQQGKKAGMNAIEKQREEAMRALLECRANFEFIKKDTSFAIWVLLGIKKTKDFDPLNPATGLHPDVIRHIRNHRNTLRKAFIRSASLIKNLDILKNLHAIIHSNDNVLGMLFNEPPPPSLKSCLPFFKSKSIEPGERAEDLRKIDAACFRNLKLS